MGHYIGLSDSEFRYSLQKWRKPRDDFETLAITETIDPGTFTANSLVTPIVTSSVFLLHGPAAKQGEHKGYHYGRCGNPTRNVFESAMARLDGAKHGLAFSSGVAAISAVVQIMSQGDHVIYVQCSNGDSDWLFRHKWKNFGIQVEFVYNSKCDNILKLIRPNTRMIWLESPANPTLSIVDIGTISAAVHQIRSDIIITVDNTFMTPVLQRPLELGADVAIYSCTKYLCGHADVTMGCLTFNSDELFKKFQENQICMGGIPSPFDCYLMIRSLKTLPLRMNKHFINGLKVAHFLENHECVQKVNHPGLKSHPEHELALRQQYGHTGMVAFFIKGGLNEGNAFLDALKLFQRAPSLGSDVSLASLPSTASHSWLPEEERLKLGITENLVRLSVGLENADKLIQDLDQALYKALLPSQILPHPNGMKANGFMSNGLLQNDILTKGIIVPSEVQNHNNEIIPKEILTNGMVLPEEILPNNNNDINPKVILTNGILPAEKLPNVLMSKDILTNGILPAEILPNGLMPKDILTNGILSNGNIPNGLL